ncbi:MULTISPECIES: hypothetical protein [unclassified Hahella]|uniref:hypothetical protein n=1 Tax=unclassified Hahella TaxID=2624107 RepID=UPI001C1E9B3B|nr:MULTISPECIES: hypothetical protein [unclassified Hahella]MBU6954977.1 hypothetical protein [Hahella sp. HN01]MDG9668091.1 hypothetical protein [Hahella sp. CR1]
MEPYESWPKEQYSRKVSASHAFGEHLFNKVRKEALYSMRSYESDRDRELVEETVDATLYAMMQLLDGIFLNAIDEKHQAEYALIQRVRDNEGVLLEESELAPDGEGLCMGFQGWREGDFG